MKVSKRLSLVTVVLQAVLFFCDTCSSQDVDVKLILQPAEQLPRPDFQVHSVFKEDYPGMSYVKMDYTSLVKPLAVIAKLPNEMPIPVHLKNTTKDGRHQVGEVEMRIPRVKVKQHELGHRCTVYFILPEYSRAIVLNLDSQNPETAVLPDFHLHVTMNTQFNILYIDVGVETNGGLVGDDISYRLYLKSETEDNVVDRYRGELGLPGRPDSRLPVWLELKGSYGEYRRRTIEANIKSTLDDPRGLLEVWAGVALNTSYNDIVEKVYTSEMVELYGKDLQTPFPPGFLGFVRDRYHDDQYPVYCNLRRANPEPCSIRCDFVGNEPSTAEIVRVLPQSTVNATRDVSFTGSGLSSTVILPFDIVSPSDSGHYSCIAKTGETEVVRNIRLIAYRSPQFQEGSSGVTNLFNDGTFSAECVAEGTPRPNVTFDTQSAAFDGRRPGDDYVIIMTKGYNEDETSAQIIVNNPEMASEIHSLRCTAINVETDDEDLYEAHYTLKVKEEEDYKSDF